MKLLLAILLLSPLCAVMGQYGTTGEPDVDVSTSGVGNCDPSCCNGCGSNCADNCKNNCADNCKNNCADNCKNNCADNCKSSCADNCNTNCCNNCQTKCSTSCKPKCVGCKPKCDANCESNCKTNCKSNGCANDCSPSATSNCQPCVFCGTKDTGPEKVVEELTPCDDRNVQVYVNNTCPGNTATPIVIPPPVIPNITFGGVNIDIKTPTIVVHNNPNITISHTCGNVHVSNTGNSSVTLKSSNCSGVNTETSKGSIVVVDDEKENCCQIQDGEFCIRQPGMMFVICFPKYKKYCGDVCDKKTRPIPPPPMPPCVPSWPYGMCRTPCNGPCHGAYFQPRHCYGSQCGSQDFGGCRGSYC